MKFYKAKLDCMLVIGMFFVFTAAGQDMYVFSQYESINMAVKQASKNRQEDLSEEELWAENLRRARYNEVAKFVMITLNEYEARIRYAVKNSDKETINNITSLIDSFVEKHFDELSLWLGIARIGPRGKIVAERITAVLDGSYKIKWGVWTILRSDLPREGEVASRGVTGTGWFVSSNVVVTCAHVVSGSSGIVVEDRKGRKYEATVLASSKRYDLALLRLEGAKDPSCLPIWIHLEQVATKVFTLGYPYSGLLGSEQKYTEGVISSMSGIAGEKIHYQISAPIQPGNSGGALVNKYGCVVGVTSSTLDSLLTVAITGSIPQNINYAIKSRYIIELLEDNGVSFKPGDESMNADVGFVANATVLVKVK